MIVRKNHKFVTETPLQVGVNNFLAYTNGKGQKMTSISIGAVFPTKLYRKNVLKQLIKILAPALGQPSPCLLSVPAII
jgi:hypothetical protein